MQQLLKPARLEPVLRNKRSHCNEKPMHRNKRKSACSNEDPTQKKRKKKEKNYPQIRLHIKIQVEDLF